MKEIILFSAFFVVTFNIRAQVKDTIIAGTPNQIYTLSNGEIYTYKKPKFFDFVTKLPKDLKGTIHDTGKKDHLIALAISALITVPLIKEDQNILEQSRNLGERVGLKSEAIYDSFGPFNNIPPNITSGIYLIGNGTTPILLGLGFATYGLIKKDYRSLNTASGLIESIAISGVFSQTIKRISGRQSPAPALIDGNNGGDWNPFPSFKAYAKNTPNYDAFPSGHMMTATAALYVITGNYPEKRWIKPLGFTLIGVLGFEMVQANVHWVSDYPIAMVMGYIIGKNIAANKMIKNKINDSNKKYSIKYNASRLYGYNMIGAKVVF